MNIGILHPGEMGISVAVSAKNSGQEIYWASKDRSERTRARADKFGLHNAESLPNLCKVCSIILSVCPPHTAQDVALEVMEAGFNGWYLDANAISPQKSLEIGKMMEAAGIKYVDGGIIGGPAWNHGETCLYLSGREAEKISTCFTNGPLGTRIVGEEIGKASALKMCYAAYSKGTSALLSAILTAAEQYNVRDELYQEWNADTPEFADQIERRVRRVTAKAWRFVGEMEEIAATFSSAGLPSGFHVASADIYRRMANFKDAPSLPELREVITSLQKQNPAE